MASLDNELIYFFFQSFQRNDQFRQHFTTESGSKIRILPKEQNDKYFNRLFRKRRFEY